MSVELLALLTVLLFVLTLGVGRAQLAKGANSAVANGAALLVVATVLGVLALVVVGSLDVW